MANSVTEFGYEEGFVWFGVTLDAGTANNVRAILGKEFVDAKHITLLRSMRLISTANNLEVYIYFTKHNDGTNPPAATPAGDDIMDICSALKTGTYDEPVYYPPPGYTIGWIFDISGAQIIFHNLSAGNAQAFFVKIWYNRFKTGWGEGGQFYRTEGHLQGVRIKKFPGGPL